MNLKISKEKTIDLVTKSLIVFYIIICLTSELILFNINFITQLHIIFVGVIIIILTQYKVKFKSISYGISKVYLLTIFLSLFIIFNSLFVRNQLLLGVLFNVVMGLIIGKYLALSKYANKIILLPFWFLVVYIFLKLFENQNPNEVFIRSRNYISFFLIITVLPYYFTRINLYKSVSIIPAFITLALCMYSLGRSGIISALLLFFGVFLALKIKKRYKKILGFIFLAIFILTFSYYLINFSTIDEIERIIDTSSWSDLGGRSTFFNNYYNNSNLFSFIFGMDTNVYKILNIGGSYIPGHVHSSILNFISVVGVCSIFFFIQLFGKVKSMYRYNLPLVFIFFAMLFRIFTETGVLFGYFDYVVWMFFYYSFNSNPNYKQIN
jgi:hypothetical protein